MRSIELLSRLDPATSDFIGAMMGTRTLKPEERAKNKAIAKAARRMSCRVCRGRQRVVDPETKHLPKGEQVEIDCPACRGTGRRIEGTNRQSVDRLPPDWLSAEQIAMLCTEMPREWFLAAVAHVTHDPQALRELEPLVAKELVEPESRTWHVSIEARSIRVLGMSRVVAASIAKREGQRIGPREGEVLMCVQRQAWERTWRYKALPLIAEAQAWVNEADHYMHMMWKLGRGEDAA